MTNKSISGKQYIKLNAVIILKINNNYDETQEPKFKHDGVSLELSVAWYPLSKNLHRKITHLAQT